MTPATWLALPHARSGRVRTWWTVRGSNLYGGTFAPSLRGSLTWDVRKVSSGLKADLPQVCSLGWPPICSICRRN